MKINNHTTDTYIIKYAMDALINLWCKRYNKLNHSITYINHPLNTDSIYDNFVHVEEYE